VVGIVVEPHGLDFWDALDEPGRPGLRGQWQAWTPSQRARFIEIAAAFGVFPDPSPADVSSPFLPELVRVGWTVPPAGRAGGGAASGEPALATGGAGPEAILAGIPTLPRSLLDWIASLPRRLLDALARLWDRLRQLLPSSSALLLLAAAVAALLLLYATRRDNGR